ncbi:helix-turn-helix domain-containing protein [bacterium]|nr:helix-turn-helix domain-containing protein [bacterium]
MVLNDLPHHIIDDALNRICSSKTFKKSPRNIRLLKFLVQCAKEGTQIKEHIVGLELFSNKYNPDLNDGKVRVYMYHLRKKLSEYYKSEGKQDTILLHIEKGQYNLSFIENKSEKIQLVLIQRVKIALSISILFIAALGIYFISHDNKKCCWDYFFESNNETLCVVADLFNVREIMHDGSWRFRHIKGVDNNNELTRYLSENNSDSVDVENPSFAYITKMGPLAMYDLTRWFTINQRDFSSTVESDFTYGDIKNKNMIFIGQYSAMSTSNNIFLKNSKKFKTLPNGFSYQNDEDEITPFISVKKNNERIDYTMVSFMPLSNGLESLFFSSNHDIGVIATVHNFTDPTWLNEFYDNIPDSVKYFNVLFKVTGLERTDMTCKFEAIEFMK